MDVDTLHPSPLQDLFLHWMSLPSTELLIRQQLQLLRSPISPSTAMRDEDDTATTDTHKGRNGERLNSGDRGGSGREAAAAEDEEEEGSGRPKFVINIPADDVTPSASSTTSLSTSPALLPAATTSPPALSGTSSPSALSPSHSPPHASTPVQTHRVALRVDTDTRFASPTNTSTVFASSSASHSPPLSPKSPARQSPPASHSPDPSQHSPHKKRKSNNVNSNNSPTASPATSPSSASTTTAALISTSPTTSSPASRTATASPPKSPRAATPPRSPSTRSPSASNVTAADRAVEVGVEGGASAIRRFYYPEGQPCSVEVRRKDERRIRRLFRKAILKQAQAEERKRAGEEEKEEEDEEEELEEPDDVRVDDDSDDGGAVGDDDGLALRREQLYALTTAVCGLSSYCLAAGTRVALANGTCMTIESIVEDRSTSLLSYDEQQHGCVYQSTEGNHLLRQGVKQCVELLLDDGQTLLCTADHRIRTLRGDVQAQHLTADDRIIAAPEGPLVAFDETDEWTLSLQLDEDAPVRLRMGVRADWERCLAFARLLGFTSVTDCGRGLRFTHLLDAQSAAADIAMVLGRSINDVTSQQPSAGCDASNCVTLPAAVVRALAAYRAAGTGAFLPAILNATDTPAAFIREYLGGLFGCAGTAPALSHNVPQQWTAVRCAVPGDCSTQWDTAVQSEFMPLIESLGVKVDERSVSSNIALFSSSIVSFADNIGFRYSIAKQQRLSLAARWYRSQALTPHQHIDQYLNACDATSYFLSPHSKPNDETVLPTWHVGIVSRRPAGLHPTYDLSVRHTHLFVANGVVAHNCNNALFAALLLHAKVYFPHHFKQGAIDEDDSSLIKPHDDAEEKSTPESSDMDTTKDNNSACVTTPNASAAAATSLSQPSTPTASTALIHLETFLSYYFTHLQPFDPPTRFFRLLLTAFSPTLPTTHPYHLTRDHFKPLVSEIVNRHPGLEFLHSTPEFQFKYAQTVIARIFYAVNVSGNERLTLYELRQSNLLLMLSLLDTEDDINKLNDFFSYEHFYVIYCKFWELDSDHDGFIDQSDLATYDDYSLTSKMIERVIGGHGRQLLSPQPGKMNYLDFIVFLVSEVDKSNRISIAYWYDDTNNQTTNQRLSELRTRSVAHHSSVTPVCVVVLFPWLCG